MFHFALNENGNLFHTRHALSTTEVVLLQVDLNLTQKEDYMS